jgi:hypothetical protein
MSTGGATAAIIAAAAAAERLRQQEEEEEMTGYVPKDLAEGWEFKIMRGDFRRPERLRAILEEEKRGGWVLLEKFDDSRIRLKRPAGTKIVEGDFADGYDPYRTHVLTLPSAETIFFLRAFGALSLGFIALILLYAILAR